jgi:DNA topoisomerase-1
MPPKKKVFIPQDSNSKILVIVESPGKIKKIRSFLGSDYIVMASVGHIMDLPLKTLGIDLNTLEATYEMYPDKTAVVKGLKTVCKNIKDVYIASDADREGEFIGYSLVTLLGLKTYKRATFHEITKNAIMNALNSPKDLDYNMIYAQQCRRIIDRLLGYLISPILSTGLGMKSLGAGRVQSVIVKMILDVQEKRENFWLNNSNGTYYVTYGDFNINNLKIKTKLDYYTVNKLNRDSILTILKIIKRKTETYNKQSIWKVNNTKSRESSTYPDPPFITSTLQQQAFYKFRFNPDKTMKVAQQLYEKGYITYMRTDSPNLSNEALFKIKDYVIETYGQEFYKYKQYKSKSNSAQEAHEAIRPTHFDVIETNDDVDNDAKNLYNLIWCRTVASQMTPYVINNLDIYIKIDDKYINGFTYKKKTYNYVMPTFIGTLSNVKHLGFKILYSSESEEENEHNILPNSDKIDFNKIKVGMIANLDQIISEEQLGTSQPLYNQPTLIRNLEKHGIGRPSTYAALLKKIMDYKYVTISNVEGITKNLETITLKKKVLSIKSKPTKVGGEKQKLLVTDLGKKVITFLNTRFSKMLDYKFTAEMENKLDLISEGRLNHKLVLNEFYKDLSGWINKKQLTSSCLN